MNELLVRVKTGKDAALTCIKSLELEAESDKHERSEVDFRYEDGHLVITIKAQDLTSMRAALNTYLRWFMMCESLIAEGSQINNQNGRDTETTTG